MQSGSKGLIPFGLIDCFRNRAPVGRIIEQRYYRLVKGEHGLRGGYREVIGGKHGETWY